MGPLVGYILKQKQPHNNLVFGTLDEPVHAINRKIPWPLLKLPIKPYIIAVDACLGKVDSVEM